MNGKVLLKLGGLMLRIFLEYELGVILNLGIVS